jgi:hypothetical protein
LVPIKPIRMARLRSASLRSAVTRCFT